jgi:flagellar motor switch protein FliN/FliY
MSKDLLTREELSMLLADDAGGPHTVPPDLATGDALFSPQDFGVLQGVLSTYLLPGVTAWSVLFGRSVQIGEPEISLVSASALAALETAVIGEVDLSGAIAGRARFVLPMAGARTLVALALGSPEPPREFDAIHRSSFASAFKYLLAEMRSHIARGTGQRVGTSEPAVRVWPTEVALETDHIVQARLPWAVDKQEQPSLLFWADLPLARGLLGLARPAAAARAVPTVPVGRAGAAPKAPACPPGAPGAPRAVTLIERSAPAPAGRPVAGLEQEIERALAPDAIVRRRAAPRAEPGAEPAAPGTGTNRLDRLPPELPGPFERAALRATRRPVQSGVERAPVQIVVPDAPPSSTAPVMAGDLRVEIGRALATEPLLLGQIISLDRLAGESVDIVVDGRLAARGEVTVVGEVLAVRVTQTVAERRRSPGGGR